MRTHSRRIALIALVATGLAAGFIWAFQPRPVPADLAVIERGTLRVTVDEEGETQVRDVYMIPSADC
jgi:HlyD family secretion protein